MAIPLTFSSEYIPKIQEIIYIKPIKITNDLSHMKGIQRTPSILITADRITMLSAAFLSFCEFVSGMRNKL